MLWLGLAPFVLACGSEDEPAKNTWENRNYLLEVPSTQWTEPPQVGNDIGEFVPHFLLHVSGSAPDRFTVTLGTADADGQQNLCSVTSELEARAAASGGVQIGPGALAVHLVHPTQPVEVDATIRELTLSNVLPSGGKVAKEGELAAVIDARELYPLFTLLPEPSPETVCAALDSYNAACVPCPTDGESFCLSLKAERLGASETEGSVVVVDAETRDVSCP